MRQLYRLPIRSRIGKDFHDLWLEAHVEHSVRFVQANLKTIQRQKQASDDHTEAQLYGAAAIVQFSEALT